MTADLFVKLTAKLYAQNVKDNEESISNDINGVAYSDSESSDSESGGGVLLFAGRDGSHIIKPSISIKITEPVKSSHPNRHAPVLHASQLNTGYKGNILSNDEGGKRSDKTGAPSQTIASNRHLESKQWLPPMEDPFWTIYINKLRVYGCESGVCDLEQKGDIVHNMD